VLLLRNPHAPAAEIAADSVAVAKLPASSPLSQDYDPPLLFAQNPDCAGHMASITKLMTAMVMLDHISDLDELVEVQESNLRRGTGNFLQVGDVASYRDLLHAMLLPSSNTAAHAIARCVGRKVLLEEQRLA
jgi:D-alanyl-D-alanine carboxypeptidase